MSHESRYSQICSWGEHSKEEQGRPPCWMGNKIKKILGCATSPLTSSPLLAGALPACPLTPVCSRRARLTCPWAEEELSQHRGVHPGVQAAKPTPRASGKIVSLCQPTGQWRKHKTRCEESQEFLCIPNHTSQYRLASRSNTSQAKGLPAAATWAHRSQT